MSRTRSPSAPFSISSINAILSSVIVVFLVRFSFANRTLREDRRWPPPGGCSYTNPWDVTQYGKCHKPSPSNTTEMDILSELKLKVGLLHIGLRHLLGAPEFEPVPSMLSAIRLNPG